MPPLLHLASEPEHNLAEGSQLGENTRSALSVLLPYLNAVRSSFLLIDHRGYVLLSSGLVFGILDRFHASICEGMSVRQVLRSMRAAVGPAACDAVFAQLRCASQQRSLTTIEVTLQERLLEIGLHPVVGGGWAVAIEDVSVRRAAESSAANMARQDPLTGLPNRLLLRERLDEALTRLHRNGEACAVLLIDLDRFKPVNDTLGHPIGDALLEKVADRLRSTVRPTDTVARIGGDEFVVLQTAVREPADTQALVRRIVDLIGRTYMVEGHLLTIGASVGVALAPSDGTDVDKLLNVARQSG